MWMYDLESLAFLQVNLAAVEKFGYTREEFLKMTLKDVLPSEDGSRFPVDVVELRSELQHSGEWRHDLKNGRTIDLQITSHMLEYHGRKAVLEIVQNITERKKGENPIRQSEMRFRSLFDHMEEGFAHCRMIFENDKPVDYEYLEVNTAFEKITGLKGVAGKRATEAIPGIKESNPELFEIYGSVAKTGQSERFETYVTPLETWFSVSVYSIQRGEFDAVFSDITKHKHAEEDSSFLSFIIKSSDDAIFGKTPDGIIVSWNAAAEELYGYTAKEILGRNVSILAPPDRPDEIPQLLENVKQGKSIRHVETVRMRKDGSLIDVSLTLSPVRDAEGRVRGSSTIARDITERKRADHLLKHYANELEVTNKELEAFAYSVSHDLRAPLRHINGFIELLAKDSGSGVSEKSARYLQIICEAAKHMGELIDDLLTFSRMAREEMRKTKLNPTSLVNEVVASLRTEIEGRTVRWIIHDLPMVTADPAMLKLAFVNLISNAQKFTRRRDVAEIEVGTIESDEKEIILFVKDNGVGFDMEYAHKLFGVFQRLHSKDEFEGTGIGLANVRRIISRHGGRTWAEGTVGVGASFYLSLPTT
jgi:PAS domain S-box-containing protein